MEDDSVSENMSETFQVALAARSEESFVGFADNEKPEILQSQQSLPTTNFAQTVANEKAKVS